MGTIGRAALLGIAAAALPALVGAGQASASSFTATSANEAFTNSTSQTFVFTITNQKIECTTTIFEGVTEGAASEGKVHSETMTVHPVTTGCTAFGFPALVSTTPNPACMFKLAAATTSGMGAVTVENCTAEAGGVKGILIKINVSGVANCEVVVPNQTIPGAVSYTNVVGASPATVEVTATATGIEADVVKSTGLCPLVTGVHNTAAGDGTTYEGTQKISSAGGVTYTP